MPNQGKAAELNYVLDRNAATAHLMATTLADACPLQEHERLVKTLPHTRASFKKKVRSELRSELVSWLGSLKFSKEGRKARSLYGKRVACCRTSLRCLTCLATASPSTT